jgi:D-alanyl-D-alanine carboxypeptidase
MFVNDPFRIGLQKTGFTNEAGHCLIIVTMVRSHPVLIVLLGRSQRAGALPRRRRSAPLDRDGAALADASRGL